MLRGISIVRGEPNAPTEVPMVNDSFSLFALLIADLIVRSLVSRICDNTKSHHVLIEADITQAIKVSRKRNPGNLKPG